MFSKTRKVLQLLFYSAMTYVAPFDFHTVPPENTIVFEPDVSARKDRKSQTARSYLSSVAQHCPHGVGEAVVKKIEFMKSSRIPNHEFLLCYVKDHRNIRGREAVIRIERLNDSSPLQPLPEPQSGTTTPSLQPPVKDKHPLSSESISHTSSHSSSHSFFGTALDLFTITCMPVIATKDCNVLSTLTFNDNSTFAAEEAAVIAMVASDAADEYSVLSHQCYWYARVVYNIILETQAGNYTKAPLEDDKRMGKHMGMKIVNDAASNILIPPSDTSKHLTQTYIRKWRELSEDIDDRKKKKEEPIRKAEAATRGEEAAKRVAESARRDAEAAQREAERERQEKAAALQELQRQKEELAKKQKEFDDYKRDLALRTERISSSQPSAV
ncbi:hypothetical protein DFS33DRAFT_1337244 [Desarmillaria ectypa]|nr:hypothetical protein DFS33DRAFT_1337244 [Desarmillaria ectypa]